ncbi:MAG TPA: glutaredoxin family protein [Marmoricola sp.]|nr:glutaredoxin family protein [Marmoricola sp.]
MTARVTVYSRNGCHLCDQALAVVRRAGVDQVDVIDIDADPALVAKYSDKVPVICVDDTEIAHWFVTEADLRAALG